MHISKTYTMESSHILPNHPGKCARLHGHSYAVEICLGGSVNPATNFVLDYGLLSQMVDPVISALDHVHLNYFIPYPSAERIAAFLGNLFSVFLLGDKVDTLRVMVSETRKTTATWDSNFPEDVQLGLQVQLEVATLLTGTNIDEGRWEIVTPIAVETRRDQFRCVLANTQKGILALGTTEGSAAALYE